MILGFTATCYGLTFPIDNPPMIGKHPIVESGYYEWRDGYQHQAWDIAVKLRTPVKSPEAGVIETADWVPPIGNHSNFGNYVVIKVEKNGHIYRHILAHLQNYKLTGGKVAEGEEIGSVGSTGIVDETGKPVNHPHLHWEVRNEKNEKIPMYKAFKDIGIIVWKKPEMSYAKK
jgi:murein DD-endopeptidase MepM/ murein hydrolase activator NlpD